MKAFATVLLLVLLASAGGCAWWRNFTYSSPEGRTCLTKCENARWECRTGCGTDAVCQKDCDEAAARCRKDCPAISVEEPEKSR